MKEAFDVSYAVHRMGEERAQRKEHKKMLKQQPAHLRVQAFNAPLAVSEEDDNDDEDIMMKRENDDDDSSNNSSSCSSTSSPPDTDQQQQQRQIESLCETLDSQAIIADDEKSKTNNALIKKLAGNLRKDNPPPPIANQKAKPAFNLDMNNSTLLGRRKNVPILHQK